MQPESSNPTGTAESCFDGCGDLHQALGEPGDIVLHFFFVSGKGNRRSGPSCVIPNDGGNREEARCDLLVLNGPSALSGLLQKVTQIPDTLRSAILTHGQKR